MYVGFGLIAFFLQSCPWVGGKFVLAADKQPSETSWQIGLAKVDITPTEWIWQAGYGARNRPAEGVRHPLMAKALVLADPAGSRLALVSCDLIGLSREVFDQIAAGVTQKTGIPSEHLVINCSHTHGGPVVLGCAEVAYPLEREEIRTPVVRYRDQLVEKVIAVVAEAARRLQPAKLALGIGSCGFAMNRRLPVEGTIRLAPNPDGPKDPTVPVLVVKGADDQPLALLFGYACHATTLGADTYEYHGDYPSYAQLALEEALPGVQAMFVTGCAGDINPEPRGSFALAETHGKSLAQAVLQVLQGSLRSVRPPLKIAAGQVQLALVDPPDRQTIESWAASDQIFRRRLAHYLLTQRDNQGQVRTAYPCPIRVVRFGDDLLFIALAGEVVVEYALRLKEEIPSLPVWVAGYCNDVFAYVPTDKILAEGGYEGNTSQVYFGFHGPWKSGIEETLLRGIHELVAATAPAP
jgi:hypothetical protein